MQYLEYLKEVAKTKKVIGYFDTYVPEEFLIALGVHPVRLMSDELEPSLSNSYIQGFCCPYAKNLLEQALTKKLDFLSGVVFSRYCDSLRGVYEVWKTEKLSQFAEFIRYAQVTREDAAPYMAKEFLSVFGRVADVLGVKFEAGKLEEAIIAVNKKRKALLSVSSMRKQGRLPVPAENFYSFVFSAAWLTTDDFMAECRKMSSLANEGNGGAEQINIVVSAAEMDNVLLFRLLDETGFFTASDDISSGTRLFKDLVSEDGSDIETMALNIAKRYVAKTPCSVKEPSGRRIDELVEEARSSGAMGVVFLRTPFCDSEGV
jgi:benzoyl-CoA reductase subunit C